MNMTDFGQNMMDFAHKLLFSKNGENNLLYYFTIGYILLHGL